MILLSLFPIIIIIVIIIAIPFFMKKARPVTIKITHWLLLIYVGVLLLATAVAPFIIGEDLSNREFLREKDIEQERRAFSQALSEGNIETIDEGFLVNEITYDYQNSTLKIERTNGYGPQVFVERKDSNDGKIEAFIYTNRFFIDGLNFTDKLGEPFQSKLTQDTLTIQSPEQTNIKVSMIKNEFTINQFTKGSNENSTIQNGISALYLRVLQNLQLIEGTDVYLEYVRK